MPFETPALPLRKFTIYRDSWQRGAMAKDGDSIYDTMLHNPCSGLECCLGQISVQAGLSVENIRYADPLMLSDAEKGKVGFMFTSIRNPKVLADWAGDAMEANDEVEFEEAFGAAETEAFREAKLTEIALAAGIELTFVDGKAPWL